MNVRPLIVRELRAEARRSGSYWLRTVAAGILTALFVWSVWNFAGNPNALGQVLFQQLTLGISASTLIVVSALASDCVSRERREGTLGLLFMTSLRAKDIVVGKTLLIALRALAILLSLLPLVGLPFLMGGIRVGEVVLALCFILIAFCFALIGGMIASIHSTQWIQSLVYAELFAGILAFCFITVSRQINFPTLRTIDVFLVGSLILAMAMVIVAVVFAGEILETNWQNETGPEREPFWVKIFSASDFWRAAFRWDTRKARDRNPIAWLQEYNWTSRLTKWGWCIVLFVAEMRMLTHFRTYIDYQMQLYYLICLGIAFSAAASFRRERQTGALELLLVTPVSAQQLIWGRLQGVWVHFLPAMAILATVWAMGPQWISLPIRFMFYLAGAYFCIPVIGFYCSLLTANVLVSWLLTLFFGLLLPYAGTQAFRWEIGRRNIPFAFFAIQLLFGLLAAGLLYENLARRRFALQKT